VEVVKHNKIIEPILKKVVKIIKKHINNGKIYLFGSWVEGNALYTSDIDIAIDAGTEIPMSKMIKIKEEIRDIPTLRSIDILDFNTLGENFKRSILATKKEIYEI
jgi:predicted nucleotidyltransferase